MKVLLINAHLTYPNWTEGTLNQAFVQEAKEFFNSKNVEVLETYIEKGYNVEEEVQKHLDADVVILQTPINWFGAPWIYKKYIDEVFNVGLGTKSFLTGDGRSAETPNNQYGTGGKMKGKKFMISATWNAPAEAFGNPEQVLLQGKTLEDIYLHITTVYRFCGVEDILESYNCFNIFRRDREDIAQDIKAYPLHLAKVLGI